MVEKCTLCKSRIVEGRRPNCANLCPTGALDFGEIGEEASPGAPGFIDTRLNPAIKIIGLRKSRFHHSIVPSGRQEITRLRQHLETLDTKNISLGQEWSLILFTLLVSLLAGLVTSSVLGTFAVNPLFLEVTAALSLGLSILHLGSKTKAWRSILNIRSSWLSREIAAYVVFLISMALYLTLQPARAFGIFSSVMGALTLISVDMVYSVAENRPGPASNSASVILTGIVVCSIASKMIWLFAAVSALKFVLYAYEQARTRNARPIRRVAAAARIVTGFLFPFLLIRLSGGYLAVVVSVSIGELINRADFYIELEITTPMRQIQRELRSCFR